MTAKERAGLVSPAHSIVSGGKREVTVKSLPPAIMNPRRLAVIAAVAALVLGGGGFTLVSALSAAGSPVHSAAAGTRRSAGTPATTDTPTAPDGGRWVASWAAAPMAGTTPAGSIRELSGQTVRNIIYTSAGGTSLRVHVSNAFGAAPLTARDVSVGVVLTGARLVPGSSHALTFGGKASVTIPAGAQALSDPLRMPVRPLEKLAISLYLPDPTGPPTNHAAALQANYVCAGDHAGDTAATAYTTTTARWLFADELDVHSAIADGTIVAFGDSITDGIHSSAGANDRWPNYLARRLVRLLGDRAPGVVDEGIGGNRVLQASRCFGASAQARFQRDALSLPAVKAVIVLEGINDIGFAGSPDLNGCLAPNPPVTAAQIEAGYRVLIEMAHARGVRIYFGTLTPFGSTRPARVFSGREALREAVNDWIRASGAFDGVIDFARALQDPRDPIALRGAYNSGDHLHPNDLGYAVMADAVPPAIAP
jgi:lysophospholipase L1-like esterase